MPTTNVCPDSGLHLQEIADALGKSRKVVVVTGAGISTNCGIPDFRSENGLYSLIQAQYDAALKNPPWENTGNFEIDDRPKKKRRVTDRWYYEVVPAIGAAVQDTNVLPSENQDADSPRPQPASQSSTSRSTPAARCSPSSSPLSSLSARTLLPPSEDFKLDDSSIIAQPQSLPATIAPSPSRSSRELSSRPSSVFTSDENSKDVPSRSDTSESAFISKIDDHTSATRLEPEQHSQSSPPSSASSYDPSKDLQQLSQSSTSRPLPNLKGRDLFDCMVWSDPFTTSIFYMFISSLRQKIQDVGATTTTHKFLRTLRDGGRLVRCYSQNIDCLEEREGLVTDLTKGAGSKARFFSRTQRESRPGPGPLDPGSPHNGGVECVLLHGSLVELRCGICAKRCSWELAERQVATLAGSAPDCPSCLESSSSRTGRGRRGLAVGRLRPDIVLYGEEHPNANLIGPLITHDLGLGPDSLLIMGTSLKVHGLKVMVKEFARAVHLKGGKVVFVNRTKPPESTWGELIDYWVAWDCDEWVLDLQRRRGDIWLPQGSVELGKRRSSSGKSLPHKSPKAPRPQVARPPAVRPQAVRDDKMNGAYQVLKILDILHHIKDSNGAKSSRSLYWEKTAKDVTAHPTKQARKPLPASKPSKEASSRKRKSSHSTVQEEDEKTAAAAQIWRGLREPAPGFNPTPPETVRPPLTELHYNRHSPTNNISNTHHRLFEGQSPNRSPWLEGLDLSTHPPTVSKVPLYAPDSLPELPAEHRSMAQSYGTHSGASTKPTSLDPLSTLSTGGTIVVDQPPTLPSFNSDDNTIVVTVPQNEKLPTRQTTEPLTPSSQRIKRLGSIAAVLSSPEPSENSSPESVYHSALEE